MKPVEVIKFRKDATKIEAGYQTTELHVGATCNKLDDLKELLVPRFDRAPRFQREHLEYDNVEYNLEGAIKQVPYFVSLQYIACPVPFSMAQIHHASVRLPQGSTDEVTPIIEAEFRKYEAELSQRMKDVPRIMEASRRTRTSDDF